MSYFTGGNEKLIIVREFWGMAVTTVWLAHQLCPVMQLDAFASLCAMCGDVAAYILPNLHVCRPMHGRNALCMIITTACCCKSPCCAALPRSLTGIRAALYTT